MMANGSVIGWFKRTGGCDNSGNQISESVCPFNQDCKFICGPVEAKFFKLKYLPNNGLKNSEKENAQWKI